MEVWLSYRLLWITCEYHHVHESGRRGVACVRCELSPCALDAPPSPLVHDVRTPCIVHLRDSHRDAVGNTLVGWDSTLAVSSTDAAAGTWSDGVDHVRNVGHRVGYRRVRTLIGKSANEEARKVYLLCCDGVSAVSRLATCVVLDSALKLLVKAIVEQRTCIARE